MKTRKPTERRPLTPEERADLDAPEVATITPAVSRATAQQERRARILAHVTANPGVAREALRVHMGGMTGQDLGTYLRGHKQRGEIVEVGSGRLYLAEPKPKGTPPSKPAKPIVRLRLVDARTPGAVARRHNCANLTACEDEWMRHKGGAMAYCPKVCAHMTARPERDRWSEGERKSAWMVGA